MNDPDRPEGPAAVSRPPLRPDMTVRQAAADYPGCREVLRRHGEPESRPTKFVVGIALRYLPLVASGPRPGPAFCRLLLAALLAGVVGGFLWSVLPGQAGWLGPPSGAALLAGAFLFLGFLLRQVGGKLRATWARLVLAAGVWLVAWAAVTLMLRVRWAADGPGGYGEPVRQLLMELAIFGFTLNAIYGFGQRLLSGIVGSATPHGGAIEAAF